MSLPSISNNRDNNKHEFQTATPVLPETVPPLALLVPCKIVNLSPVDYVTHPKQQQQQQQQHIVHQYQSVSRKECCMYLIQ